MKVITTPQLMFGGQRLTLGIQREGYVDEIFDVIVRKIDRDLYVSVTEIANPDMVIENVHPDYFSEDNERGKQ